MKAPRPFAEAINALNGEWEFSPNAISEPRRLEQPDGSVGIYTFHPYWIQLRNEALARKEREPEYCIPPDAIYRKGQGVFVRTLQDLVKKWRESEGNRAAFFQRHPDVERTIESFLRRNPLTFIYSSDSFGVFGPIGQYSVARFPLGKDRPVVRARNGAVKLFIDLMCHPALNRLGQCLRCNRYFFGRPGQKCCPRPRRCGSYRAAIEGTKRRWKKERRDKLARAQEACAEWERRQSRGEWKRWVAKRIKVTPNWLTRAVNKRELTPPMAEKGRKP
ncbi:MAG TPA: hypothetical protein VG204_02735 [Terriglobia bacterium]|nr:hypothetical protein [Terriglobia bacterium]